VIPLFNELDEHDQQTIGVLHGVAGWPQDWGKDTTMMVNLHRAFPEIDLMVEAVAWAAWMTEHEQKKKIKHRHRFGNWVKNTYGWDRERSDRSGRAHQNPEREGHGNSVQSPGEW